jgi:hypothetical protein
VEISSPGRETDKPLGSLSDTAVREVRSFAITSVLHPRTKEKISVTEAVNQGILDRDRGIYVTFDQQGRRMSIPISEAVDKGWVFLGWTTHDTINVVIFVVIILLPSPSALDVMEVNSASISFFSMASGTNKEEECPYQSVKQLIKVGYWQRM